MPEGDTVHKLAAALTPRWVGLAPTRVELKAGNGAQLCGHGIRSVSALGKHLFVEFEHGLQLRTHLGLYGSWHRYALDEAWQKPKRQAWAVLEIGGAVYVLFNAKACEIVRTDGVRERALRTRLSLDLVATHVDLGAIPRRARAFVEAEEAIVDVLLDQRIACGIGNVYKSEVLFLHRVHPLTPLEALSDGQLGELYCTAAVLLRRNLAPGPRVTRFENDAAGRLWVYRRSGLPCFRCGAIIQYRRCGKDWRSTYWCPGCQPPPPGIDSPHPGAAEPTP